MSDGRSTAATRRGTTATIAIVLGFAVGFMWASNALLMGSHDFWELFTDGVDGYPTAALRLEADLRLRSAGSAPVIILGSSVARTNVGARLLAKQLGLGREGVMRVPLPGAPPVESAMLLADIERLDPEVVVYLATAWTLYRPFDWGALRFYDPSTALALATPRELIRDRADHASLLMNATHLVLRHREALRRVFFPALFALDSEDGTSLFPEQNRRQEQRRLARRTDFGCDSIQVRALRQMARRFRAKGIRFAVAAVPGNTPAERRLGLIPLLDDCLQREAEVGAFVWIGHQGLTILPGHFRDGMHLNRQGRARFTRHLAPFVGEMLSAAMPSAGS